MGMLQCRRICAVLGAALAAPEAFACAKELLTRASKLLLSCDELWANRMS